MTTKLDQLKARLAKRTPGEWYADKFCIQESEHNNIALVNLARGSTDDAEFIAHAPADMALLLAVVEASQAARMMNTDDAIEQLDTALAALNQPAKE